MEILLAPELIQLYVLSGIICAMLSILVYAGTRSIKAAWRAMR